MAQKISVQPTAVAATYGLRPMLWMTAICMLLQIAPLETLNPAVKLKPEPGFHFVPIDYSAKLADYYLPCPLSHDDYPQLIPEGPSIGTLCMPAVLATYNFPKGSDRARRLARFIDYYFERFDKLKQPSFHPKWKDINIAATVPGWKTAARQIATPAPLLTKVPVALRPLAWFRRNPSWRPYTFSKRSANRDGVNASGRSQPPA